MLVDGRWEVEGGRAGMPFERARIALLPLLERPRGEVEREALLRPGDPDFAEAVQAVIEVGLTGWSEYWMSRALPWIADDEIPLFAGQLREIADGRGRTQSTRHAAKRLLRRGR